MTMAPLETSVALFIFNRPETTQRVFEAIARARPAQLLIVADGARADRPGEGERCARARAIAERVDWSCAVRTHYAATNLGCRRRIASGLDWVFSQVDEAIILEDDCLPDATFFPFCAQLLARYRDDARVHMIRGTNLLGGRRLAQSSYYFSNFYNIWGWATWARAWRGYDVEMRQWPEMRETGFLARVLPRPEMARLVGYLFDETHAGRVDTWDYQWAMLGWQHGRVAAVPATNLITNIGHGADATHTRDAASHLAEVSIEPLTWPLVHPRGVEVLAAADRREWSMVYPGRAGRAPLWQRVRRRLQRVLA